MTLAAVGGNSLSLYPQIGLILFLVVFVAVTVRAMRRSNTEVNRWAHLPLEDSTDQVVSDASQEGSAR